MLVWDLEGGKDMEFLFFQLWLGRNRLQLAWVSAAHQIPGCKEVIKAVIMAMAVVFWLKTCNLDSENPDATPASKPSDDL